MSSRARPGKNKKIKNLQPQVPKTHLTKWECTSSRRDTTVILAENQPSTSSSGFLLAIPVSTHVKKKKRGHKRIQSKERVPTITDIEDSTQEEFSKLSNGNHCLHTLY